MHNTRIERLWVEVGSQFVRRWKVFFKRLEAEYGLIKTNKTHLWLLHHLFLQDINEDSGRFQEDWNRHGVSGEVTQSRAPEVSSANLPSEQVPNTVTFELGHLLPRCFLSWQM